MKKLHEYIKIFIFIIIPFAFLGTYIYTEEYVLGERISIVNIALKIIFAICITILGLRLYEKKREHVTIRQLFVASVISSLLFLLLGIVNNIFGGIDLFGFCNSTIMNDLICSIILLFFLFFVNSLCSFLKSNFSRKNLWTCIVLLLVNTLSILLCIIIFSEVYFVEFAAIVFIYIGAFSLNIFNSRIRSTLRRKTKIRKNVQLLCYYIMGGMIIAGLMLCLVFDDKIFNEWLCFRNQLQIVLKNSSMFGKLPRNFQFQHDTIFLKENPLMFLMHTYGWGVVLGYFGAFLTYVIASWRLFASNYSKRKTVGSVCYMACASLSLRLLLSFFYAMNSFPMPVCPLLSGQLMIIFDFVLIFTIVVYKIKRIHSAIG